MKLRVTITDNETGDILREYNTNAFIAGCKTENGIEAGLTGECDDFDLAATICVTELAVRSVKKQKGFMFVIMTKLLPLMLNAAKKKAAKAAESIDPEEDIK